MAENTFYKKPDEMWGVSIETKASSVLHSVPLKTQKTDKGAILGAFKCEYDPIWKPAGKALKFTLAGTEQSALNPPTNLSLAAKVKATKRSAITYKYGIDKKKSGVSLKLDFPDMTNEVKWTQGGPVCVESEYLIDSKTKFQVETIGKKIDALKATRAFGSSQVKLKYSITSKVPILGLDTYRGSQKWDLEYNVKTEQLVTKVKAFPVTLSATNCIGRSGFGPITWAVTGERTIKF